MIFLVYKIHFQYHPTSFNNFYFLTEEYVTLSIPDTMTATDTVVLIAYVFLNLRLTHFHS